MHFFSSLHPSTLKSTTKLFAFFGLSEQTQLNKSKLAEQKHNITLLISSAITAFPLNPIIRARVISHTSCSGSSAMATLPLAMLILAAMAGHSSATWCICKDGLGDASLQKVLDYACGAGADCNPIRPNSACFIPNTVRAHCSYAVNSYFQKKGQTQGSCDFSGAATISTSDPSSAGCSYPSNAGGGGTGFTPVTSTPPGTTVPGSTTPSTRAPSTPTTSLPPPAATTMPSTSTNPTPYNASPTGVLGGAGVGTGPSGAGITTDESHGQSRLHWCMLSTLFNIFFFFIFMLWWG